MRDFLALSFSVALPWIAGTLWVRALSRPAFDDRTAISIGYGYLVGLFGVTAVMRLESAIGVRWGTVSIALPVAALAAAAYIFVRRSAVPRRRRRPFDALAAMPPLTRAVFYLLLLLTGVRAVMLGLDVLWTPLLPYDAWAHWASKARVWYEYGRMMPFVRKAEWLGSGALTQFTDNQAAHPGTVPLFQVWSAICLDRWDESLVNLPWAACFVSLGIAFHAQLRRLGISALKALFGTYLLLSLPFLTIHVALAGMADVFVASAFGLAAMALWQWTLGRKWNDAVLALVMAGVCASLKVEGFLWVLTLVPGVLVALHRRVGLAITTIGALAAIVFLAVVPSDLKILGYLFIGFQSVTSPLYQHLFVMDNWHLLWYAAIAVIAANYRLLMGNTLAPMSVTMLAAAAFVFVVFFFSNAAGGVAEESLINRLALHLVPALVFYLALILRERSLRTAAAGHESAAAAVASS